MPTFNYSECLADKPEITRHLNTFLTLQLCGSNNRAIRNYLADALENQQEQKVVLETPSSRLLPEIDYVPIAGGLEVCLDYRKDRSDPLIIRVVH